MPHTVFSLLRDFGFYSCQPLPRVHVFIPGYRFKSLQTGPSRHPEGNFPLKKSGLHPSGRMRAIRVATRVPFGDLYDNAASQDNRCLAARSSPLTDLAGDARRPTHAVTRPRARRDSDRPTDRPSLNRSSEHRAPTHRMTDNKATGANPDTKTPEAKTEGGEQINIKVRDGGTDGPTALSAQCVCVQGSAF